MRPRLLDLFCGAGGAARGYQLAGFCVLGIDNRPQKNYAGCWFHQADALEYVREHGREFDAIHASPPCQKFSVASALHRNNGKEYPDCLTPIREQLKKLSIPWIIENVFGAPMRPYTIMLCGPMFGLKVFR